MRPPLPLAALAILVVACAPAPAQDFASEVLAATFKLSHPDSTATCLLVRGPSPVEALYLVTSAHVLEKTSGETADLVLRDAGDGGTYQRRDREIRVRKGGNPLWFRGGGQDVAALPLPADAVPAAAGLPLASLATAESRREARLHIGSPLLVLTFPQRVEANSAGFPVARQGVYASPPFLPLASDPTFLIDATTFAGDSGGPVFVEGAGGQPLVLGLVVGQHFFDVRSKSDYQETLVRYPLGLGIVVRAHFIRQAIEAAEAGSQEAAGR